MFQEGLLLTFLLDDNAIHISHPLPGGGGGAESFLFKVLHIHVSQYGPDRDPIAAPSNCY